MISPVVVENNRNEGRLYLLSPLVQINGFPPRAVVNGLFLFLRQPSGRDSKWAEWPEPKKHRTQYTPVQNATGVGLATGNATSTRWKQGLWIK